MIHAIRSNKAGRNFRDSTDWRSLFEASEDSLTSSVFGHLAYLPPALLWPLFQEAVHCFVMPGEDQFTALKSYEFWPRWNAYNTRNVRNVEPDVFIRTEAFDLIIEAKRYDYNQQDSAQWHDQLQAYLNDYGDENRPVLLLAIGGIYSGDEQPTTISCGGREAIVYKCRWLNLLNSIQDLRKKLETGQDHIGNILTDIVHGFGLHGYTTRPLLSTLPLPLRPLQYGVGLQLFLIASS